MELQLLRADGSPASDAIVSVAEAPSPMPDVAAVADAAGRVSIDPPVSGDYLLNIWLEGRNYRMTCRLAPNGGTVVVRLPA
jgi:hypothetical protein